MADFRLGRLKFKWRGAWTASTAYVIDDIIKSLDEEWHHVIISAREISGDDLIRLRNEVQSAQARGGFNFSTILEEIDKYKIVSE